MKSFIQRFGPNILGVSQGFDRLRFRGTRRFLANATGMMRCLWQRQVLLKDFKAFAGNLTTQVRRAVEEVARTHGRPLEYLHNSDLDKEAWARDIAQRNGIQQGLIGVRKSVECCWSYEVERNGAEKKLQLRGQPSKCLHYYHYFRDAEVGLVYVRVQAWFPFTVHLGMNGRERLARCMDQVGLRYRRRDNCHSRGYVETADSLARREFVKGSGRGRRFWTIEASGTQRCISYGMVTSEQGGVTRTRRFATEVELQQSCRRLIAARLRMGYRRVDRSTNKL